MPRSLWAIAAVSLLVGSCKSQPAATGSDAALVPGADAGPVDARAVFPDAAVPADRDAEPPDSAAPADRDAEADAAQPDSGPDAGPPCVEITATASVVATAAVADDHALLATVSSASATSWGEVGNEAVILEVLKGSSVLGHLVLHQGVAAFEYTFATGALAPGDAIGLRVSPLSASAARQSALACGARLVPAAALGTMADGLRHAPIVKWPAQKRFDDLPVVLGYSRATRQYEMVYTNENGGTVVQCGGGAAGMQAEYARWGRGCDIEGLFNAGSGSWDHCPTSDAGTVRRESQHPIFYYGDGHNRVYSSRGGYGQACGTGAPEMADGPLEGFNADNPGNEPEKDEPFVLVMRLVPVDLDALGYAQARGRREAMLDAYSPWVYRLTALELTREGKIDGKRCLPLERYLYVDVQVGDVNGYGDSYCDLRGVHGGFKLRVATTLDGGLSGPQMTGDYAGGALVWKRLALPLDRTYTASQIARLVFDAYDNDGIYLVSLGDAFMARAQADDGATLEYVHRGVEAIDVYVDDDSSGCQGGYATGGPTDAGFRCVGGSYTFGP